MHPQRDEHVFRHNQLFGAIHNNQHIIIKTVFTNFKSVKKQCTQKITDEHRAGISCLTQLGQTIYEIVLELSLSYHFISQSRAPPEYRFHKKSLLPLSCFWNRGPSEGYK